MMAKQILALLIFVAATLAACDAHRVANLHDYYHWQKDAGDKLIVSYFWAHSVPGSGDLLTTVEDLGYPKDRVLVLTVDLDQSDDGLKSYEVLGELPHVFLIRKTLLGKEVEGLRSKDALTAEIDAQLKIQDAERELLHKATSRSTDLVGESYPAHMVRNLDDYDEQLRTAGDKLVVVFFFWSGEVPNVSGQFHDVSRLSYPKNRVLVLMVDLGQASLKELLERYKFHKLPTVYLIHKNKIRKQLVAIRFIGVLTAEIDWQLRIQDAEREAERGTKRKTKRKAYQFNIAKRLKN